MNKEFKDPQFSSVKDFRNEAISQKTELQKTEFKKLKRLEYLKQFLVNS